MALRLISVLCAAIASLIGWGSLACSIASVALITWSHTGPRYYGLFQICANEDNICNGINDQLVKHWLYTVRAFIIMMIIFGGFGCLANIGSLVRRDSKSIRASSALKFFMGGLFGLIGCAIYTGAKESGRYGSGDLYGLNYGSAFVLGWISCCCFIVASIFQGISAATAPKYEVH